jgi:cyclopropane fatty-acyl-phospholipid synthase-like methyltransferase
MNKQWDEIFKTKGKALLGLQPDLPKIVKLFKKRGVKRVLDLGCGSGRHLIYLSKNDFDIYGIDIAKHGIEISKKWLKEESLKANLKISNIYKKLPYKDKFFDAIISIRVINHGTIQKIRKLIKEVERILKPKGLIFITTIKSGKAKKGGWKYKQIAKRTIIPLSGPEKGLPHYWFNHEIIRKEFNNFKISKIWLDSKDSHALSRHYAFIGKLKK